MRDATRICDYFYGAMTLFIKIKKQINTKNE